MKRLVVLLCVSMILLLGSTIALADPHAVPGDEVINSGIVIVTD